MLGKRLEERLSPTSIKITPLTFIIIFMIVEQDEVSLEPIPLMNSCVSGSYSPLCLGLLKM